MLIRAFLILSVLNASDALDKHRLAALQDESLADSDDALIRIWPDAESNILFIEISTATSSSLTQPHPPH